LAQEKVLIIGLGQVGHALFELFKESGRFGVYGLDVDSKRMEQIVGKSEEAENIAAMHICYPCAEQQEFVRITANYIRSLKPKLTIIESTVPPQTTRRIREITNTALVYSPIRGMHKSLETMKKDILFWKKYVGGTTKDAAIAAQEHFQKLGLQVKLLKSPEEAELAKLFETTYRAWMITFFQEMHRISRHFGADYNEVVDMLQDVHIRRFNKPLHYPGIIGGHCLIPNTKLLLRSYDSQLLQLIIESNEKREEEMKDNVVKEEVEKIRYRVEAIEKMIVERGLRLQDD